jgi:hypothetical protein
MTLLTGIAVPANHVFATDRAASDTSYVLLTFRSNETVCRDSRDR